MTPNEYKRHKGLDRQNLRDHMNDLELIFAMLGERVSTEITRTKDAQLFNECSIAAKEGGEVAGNARKDAEKKIGKPISTQDNYLEKPQSSMRKLPKKQKQPYPIHQN